jgi:hypothetical protein
MFIEGVNQRCIVSDAREKESFRARDAIGSSSPTRVGSEAMQGALDGRDIPGTVVDERNFHRSPLVLGKMLRSRRSREAANRSARAKALKSASTW